MALLGERATPERIAQVDRLYGLDRPISEQYLTFLGASVQARLRRRRSSTQRPVTEEILRLFPATIELAARRDALRRRRRHPARATSRRGGTDWVDNASVVGSLIGVTIPVFFLGYLLKYVFAVKLGWLPATGRQDAASFTDHPTGFYVLDGLLIGGRTRPGTRCGTWSCRASRSAPSRWRSSPGSPGPPCSTSSTRTTCAPPRPRA